MKRPQFIITLIGVIVLTIAFQKPIRRLMSSVTQKFASQKSVKDRLVEYGPEARIRLRPHFERAGLSYPPRSVTWVNIKDEAVLQMYASGQDGVTHYILNWPVLKASGGPGPKLREGDRQVPEGVYEIESLNPNSRFHLALRVGYPNSFDREKAAMDGRTQLGGDIMIHGDSVSIGCLAMGDETAEELFVLAADTGLGKVQLISSPVDFRKHDVPHNRDKSPTWIDDLYARIRDALNKLPLP